jgi:hypothetical protein
MQARTAQHAAASAARRERMKSLEETKCKAAETAAIDKATGRRVRTDPIGLRTPRTTRCAPAAAAQVLRAYRRG